MTAPASNNPASSPKWGPTAKLLVGLVYVVILLALLVYSRSFIGPLLLAFILTFLLHPVAAYISNTLHLSWRGGVNLLYLILVILLLTSFTLTGLALFQQILNLISEIQKFITALPDLLASLSRQIFAIGPFRLDLSQFDLATLGERVLGYVQPLLGRMGTLVGSFATSAVTTIGWALFVLLISYFFLVDASRVPEELLYVEVPGYDADVRRLARELRRIWDAFLRGQLIMFGLVIIVYTILLTVLGVRYSYAIAILAGLARFVPYLGPFVTWATLGLVTYFQGGNYFHLDPWQYTLLAIGLGVVIDQVFDNLVSPRILGGALGVNPAAVLIAAIVMTNLIGIIGLLLAAPVLATLKLLGQYTIRKMLDLEPWPEKAPVEKVKVFTPRARLWRRIQAWFRAIKQRQ
jgi:predicted PurR-regulated permease PerM